MNRQAILGIIADSVRGNKSARVNDVQEEQNVVVITTEDEDGHQEWVIAVRHVLTDNERDTRPEDGGKGHEPQESH